MEGTSGSQLSVLDSSAGSAVSDWTIATHETDRVSAAREGLIYSVTPAKAGAHLADLDGFPRGISFGHRLRGNDEQR